MWKMVNGKIIQTTDETRVKFRTNISRAILRQLKELAEAHNTHINYLLESGLKVVLTKQSIEYDKKSRPKDRVQYKTTYDQELLEELKRFASVQGLFMNDVIEYSVNYIDLNDIKDRSYKHRVENG